MFPYTYSLPKALPPAVDAQVTDLIRKPKFLVHCGKTPIDEVSLKKLESHESNKKHSMLNDEIINGYLALIQQRLPVNSRIRFCGSYFFAKLREDKQQKRTYNSKRSMTKKYVPKGVRFMFKFTCFVSTHTLSW